MYSRADQDTDLAEDEYDQRGIVVRHVHVVVGSVFSHRIPHGEQHCT